MHRDDIDRKLKLLGIGLHALGTLVVLAIVLFTAFVVYSPIDHRVAEYAGRTKELKRLLGGEAQVHAKHTRLSKELAAARKQAIELNSRIPDEPREADFLAQVSQLADQVGLQIQDYRPGTVTSEQNYSTMQVELICQGDYASICSFVDRLAELPRFSTVVQLQIEGKDEQKQYSAKLSLKLYYAVEGQAALVEKEWLVVSG
jgi:Tfp pilus assembly protein PilO